MALSVKGASALANSWISIAGAVWSSADKRGVFPAEIMTEWLRILLPCTFFNPWLNRKVLAAWSVATSPLASANCRRILRCPSLQRAQAGVGAGRGHALFWEPYSITKCFLLCARFWKTLLSDNSEKQGVLKFCVVYFFFLFSHCLELRYAQRVQEKVYCCLFLYKSFDFFFFTTVRLPLTCRSQHKQTDFSFAWFYPPNPGDAVVTRSLSFAAWFALTIWMSEEWLYFPVMHQTFFFF